MFNNYYKVVCHAHENNLYQMDFSNVKLLDMRQIFMSDCFLEAWVATKALNAGNNHISIPEVSKTQPVQREVCVTSRVTILRTVPPIVIAHTFCASRHIRVSEFAH